MLESGLLVHPAFTRFMYAKKRLGKRMPGGILSHRLSRQKWKYHKGTERLKRGTKEDFPPFFSRSQR